MQSLKPDLGFYHSRIQVPGIIIVVGVKDNGIRSAHRLIPPSQLSLQNVTFSFLSSEIFSTHPFVFLTRVSLPEERRVEIPPHDKYVISLQIISQRKKKKD